MVSFTLVDDQFILCEVKEYFQLWGKNMVRWFTFDIFNSCLIPSLVFCNCNNYEIKIIMVIFYAFGYKIDEPLYRSS